MLRMNKFKNAVKLDKKYKNKWVQNSKTQSLATKYLALGIIARKKFIQTMRLTHV